MPSSLPPAKAWGIGATLGLSLAVFLVFGVIQILVAIGFVMLPAQNQSGMAARIEGLSTNGLLLSIATVASTVICTALIVGLIRLRKSASVGEYLALRKPDAESLVKWILATVVFIVVSDLLRALIDQPMVPSFITKVYATAYSLPLLYLATAVMAPIFEEVCFRGFLLRGLRQWQRGAIVFTAGVWALSHIQYAWYDLLAIFGFGLLLGYARLKTNSLYVPISMHALNNLVAVLQVALQMR